MRFKFYALWLCLLCGLVYLLQVSVGSFTGRFLLNDFAWSGPWRFLSAIFLHGSVAHLLLNVFALGLFGSILEGIVGGRRFLFVFFVTGVFANLVAVNFYASSLGASGAIFGVIGCLILLRPLMVIWAFGMPMPIFVAGIIWVVGDVIQSFVPSSSVGTIAHLSGIFFGALFGLFYRRRFGAQKTFGKIRYKLDEGMMRRWEDGYLR